MVTIPYQCGMGDSFVGVTAARSYDQAAATDSSA
jgi:hypothetical protein